jgi:hypothetical protein
MKFFSFPASLLIALSLFCSQSFVSSYLSPSRFSNAAIRQNMHLRSSPSELSEHNMSVDELKSELELRGVDYEDCISKNELAVRLIQSRVDGKASPDIVRQFNDLDQDIVSQDAFDDEDIMSRATSKDGSLPGGTLVTGSV